MSGRGWIGVDLDGTLAEYHGWKGVDHIGAPIQAMVARVKKWLAEGKDVRIFTARAARKPGVAPSWEDINEYLLVTKTIEAWCQLHLGRVLPITCIKDFGMIELWDDRCVQVVTNTGERADGVRDAAA